MRIDKNTNILFHSIDQDKVISKGDTLTGKILDIKGKVLLLHINELGIVNASCEKDLKPYIGKEITFIVESFNEKLIVIKPNIVEINNEENSKVQYKKEEYLENVLRKFNIEKTQLNTELVKSLMEYSVKLDEDNIQIGVNLLNKLNSMMKLNEEEEHIENEFEHVNVTKDDTKVADYLVESDNDNDNVDDQIVEEDSIDVGSHIVESDINDDDIAHLKYLLKDNGVNLLPKTIAFLIKYNIKPTLNNIKNFIELNLDMEIFSEDYEILKNILNKEFTNLSKNIIIGNESPKNLIEESQNIYLNYLDQIMKYLKKENLKAHKEIYDTFNRFESKLKLIKDLNKGLNFIYLPIEIKRDLDRNLDSIITLIKKRRHRYDYQDAINVSISLKTANFGKVQIYLKVSNSDMRVEFSNLDKEDINFIKSKEEYLRKVVESAGYDVVSIDYVDKSSINILNILTVNSNPLYCLDIKV